MATLVNGGDAPVCQWQINGKDAGAGGIYYSSLNFANGDQVTCIMTSNATCASPATVISNAVTMAVKPPTPPAVTITPPAAPVCAGTPVTFTAAPVNGGAAPVYHWDVNGQDVGSGSSYTSSSLANGDRVSCVLTSNSTCASNVTATSNLVTLSVNSWSVPSVTISASADAVCAGMPVTFTPAAANSGTAPQYQWQVNGVNMGSGGSYTTSSLTSSDRVACSMVSNAACVSPATATSNTLTLSVTPSPTPSVSITASAGPVCEGTPVTFTAAATNGGNAPGYRWQVNGASVGTDGPGVGTDGATYTSSTFSNNDIITCILTSNATCASPATVASNPVAMTVYPLPVIAPGQVFYMYGGQPVTLNPVISGSIARFLWTPAAGLSVDTIRDPIASLPVSTLYTLEVQTTDGCQSSSIIKVEPVQKMGIPNAFTPNGDGNNDVFYVLGGPPGARVKDLAVFNRWGEQIFQVRDAAPGDRRFGWNGSYKGSPAPTGTYVYMIIVEFADATQQKFSGTVNLIR
jgi:gliding motility-associated-like protein